MSKSPSLSPSSPIASALTRLGVLPILGLGLTIGTWATSASACPAFLEGVTSNSLRLIDVKTGELVNNGDVCAFNDRLEKARASIRAQGVDPDMIADARAPRLIDMGRWEFHTKGFLNIFGSFDPRFVYADPKGNWTTWPGWDSAATYVDSVAKENYRDLSQGTAKIPHLDFKWLSYMHARALASSEPGLAGKLRQGQELGIAYMRKTAPKVSEINAVENNEYKSLINPAQSIVTFHRSRCFDELTIGERLRMNRGGRGKGKGLDLTAIDAEPGSDFKDSKGVLRHCGYFVYAATAEVLPQLEALFADIDRRVDSFTIGRTFAWQTSQNTGPHAYKSEDPVLIAARAQRWFVSIHPFGGGNGRTSRFFMDYLSQSLGLPAATVYDTNQDVVISEKAWAVQVAIGMERVVRVLEDCSKNIRADRCQVSEQVYQQQMSIAPKQDQVSGAGQADNGLESSEQNSPEIVRQNLPTLAPAI